MLIVIFKFHESQAVGQLDLQESEKVQILRKFSSLQS